MPRPRLYDEQRVTTAIRIPVSLHEDLHDAARARNVSANHMVLRAIEDYLFHLDESVPS